MCIDIVEVTHTPLLHVRVRDPSPARQKCPGSDNCLLIASIADAGMSVEDRVADATALVPGVSAGVAGFLAFPYRVFRSSAHDVLHCGVQVLSMLR